MKTEKTGLIKNQLVATGVAERFDQETTDTYNPTISHYTKGCINMVNPPARVPKEG